MKIHYIEIVTPDVESTCARYAKLHGATFANPDPFLGGARTAEFANGGLMGIRPPLRDDEAPIVRHYVLVDDIEETVKQAEESGALVALPPMELPGHGTCAIVIQNGFETGFWQL